VARYGLVALLFAMGLMCKPMLVTLPLVLLLLDYWPLRRAKSAGGLVMEKLPLLFFSAASCLATLLEQTKLTLPTGSSLSAPLRLGNALVSCMVYLEQMVYPAGLAIFYPYPYHGLPPWEVALAGALLVTLSALALCQWRKQPWLAVGWLWYLVMLLPVAGIIQVGGQAHADRYTYLPQIGIYMGVTWLVAEWRVSRAALGGLMTGVLAVLMVCAWKQTAYWKNSEVLWTHAIACTTANDVAHSNLGLVFLQKGRADDAITEYQKALEIRPFLEEAHYNLGVALLQKGRADDAIAQFQAALRIKPDFATAHHTLGDVFFQEGRLDEAVIQYQQTLQMDPHNAEACVNLGNILMQKGQLDEAISHFQRAVQIQPEYAQAHNNLGNALMQKGRVDEAISHFQKALQIRPDYQKAYINLQNALRTKGEQPIPSPATNALR
jgi:Flp pilus assembly protein TadD